MNKLRIVFITFLFGVFALSCQNYESKEYIDEEDKAIGDLILELTGAEDLIKIEGSDTLPILYILDNLNNNFL